MSDARSNAVALHEAAAARGDQTGWFETLYATAGDDASAIPWANLAANPNLVVWLDRERPPVAGRAALVVGCGLGDDAEELARRGFAVTAFDVAPAAVAWCRRRFAGSGVTYETADLLDPPDTWVGQFNLVFEAYTLQVLRGDARRRAVVRVAGMVAPGGTLLVVCRGRDPAEPPGSLPYPLTRDDLKPIETVGGLARWSFEDFLDGEASPVRRFRVAYMRDGSAR